MLFRKTPDEMNEQELEVASSAVQSLIDERIALRNNPKYKKKFKNQPAPTINPALLELQNQIKEELEKRKNMLTKEEMELLTPEELETLNADDLETMKLLKQIAVNRKENINGPE